MENPWTGSSSECCLLKEQEAAERNVYVTIVITVYRTLFFMTLQVIVIVIFLDIIYWPCYFIQNVLSYIKLGEYPISLFHKFDSFHVFVCDPLLCRINYHPFFLYIGKSRSSFVFYNKRKNMGWNDMRVSKWSRAKKYTFVIIYSPVCHSNSWWLSLLLRNKMGIFLSNKRFYFIFHRIHAFIFQSCFCVLLKPFWDLSYGK